jgi:hypothetical protein
LTARISLKTLAILALPVAAICLLIGFCLDSDGFAGNLLAEVVGVLASVLLAVFVVERAVEQDRANRWGLVSAETTTTLRLTVVRAAHFIYLMLPVPRPPNADPYTIGLLVEGRLPQTLQLLAHQVREGQINAAGSDVVAGLEDYMALIRSGVMPQLLAIGERELVATLSALENAFQELVHAVWLEDRFGPTTGIQPATAELVEALAEVSAVIASKE